RRSNTAWPRNPVTPVTRTFRSARRPTIDSAAGSWLPDEPRVFSTIRQIMTLYRLVDKSAPVACPSDGSEAGGRGQRPVAATAVARGVPGEARPADRGAAAPRGPGGGRGARRDHDPAGGPAGPRGDPLLR